MTRRCLPVFDQVESPRSCSYLPDETAQLHYQVHRGLSPEVLESFLARGWRRFGAQLFRPRCRDCSQCVPLRVVAERFEFRKSHRRLLRQNAGVEVTLHRAHVSEEHVQLYNRWHAAMHTLRDWPLQTTSPQDYARSFLQGEYPSAHELQYRADGRVIGVGLIDVLPQSLSSIYFFHDPEWRPRSPGTFSMLREIDLAQRLGLPHLYLGYWIARCPSMAYKNRFQPSEVLYNRPEADEVPDWRPCPAEPQAGLEA